MMEIKNILAEHYRQITEIYLQGIATGIATFQTESPDWEAWNNSHLSNCRIAAFEEKHMAGWAALSPVSSRSVYAGVAEVSIYVAANFRNKGVDKLLLSQLVKESEQAGLWTLQSGIFKENVCSINLHQKAGFRQIGYREKIGMINGIWHDNVIMERRSRVVGVIKEI